MASDNRVTEKKESSTEVTPATEKTGSFCGRKVECELNCKYFWGLVALVAAAVLISLAAVLAAGVFGGGQMGFIAGGLTIGSMIALGAAVVLLIPSKYNTVGDSFEKAFN